MLASGLASVNQRLERLSITSPCRSTTRGRGDAASAGPGTPRRCTWKRRPRAVTSAIEVLRDQAGQLGGRLEGEEVAGVEGGQARTGDDRGEALADLVAARAAAVDAEHRHGQA